MNTLSEETQLDQGPPSVKNDHPLCRFCRMEINKSAKVCHHCQSNQNILMAYLDRFALIISIGLLILAFMQFYEARNDRISAEKALNRAEQAQISIEKMDQQFKIAIKAFAENNYIIEHQYTTWHSTKSANERFSQNINLLSEYAIPEKHERDQWVQSLEDLYPKK